MKITRWIMKWGGRVLLFLVVSLGWTGPPGICGDNVHLGIRISSMITGNQLSFVNARYEFVLTEYLGDAVRAMVQGPRLFLYRSIQGTWSGFHQFDWSHINACENMFCHHQGFYAVTGGQEHGLLYLLGIPHGGEGLLGGHGVRGKAFPQFYGGCLMIHAYI